MHVERAIGQQHVAKRLRRLPGLYSSDADLDADLVGPTNLVPLLWTHYALNVIIVIMSLIIELCLGFMYSCTTIGSSPFDIY